MEVPSSNEIDMDVFLSIFLAILATAAHEEHAAFIYDNDSNTYFYNQIARGLDEREVSRKVSSTEAYQAFAPRNMLKGRIRLVC